jgi:hypothetical protein
LAALIDAVREALQTRIDAKNLVLCGLLLVASAE